MANLLDTIQQNRAALSAEKPEPAEETSRIQKLLRAKTGQAVAPSETGISNIAEQVAAGQTQAQISQLGQGMAVQQAADTVEQAKLAQQERLQRQEADQARKFQTVQTRMQTNQILNDLSRERGSLDLDKNKAKLEQVGFLLAFQNKQYTDKLQDIGKRNRLDDQVAFNEALQQQSFGMELDLLKDKLGKNDILQASDREFQTAMSNLSIQEAQAIADMEMQYDQQVAAIKAELMRQGVSAEAAQAAAETQAAGSQAILKGGVQLGEAYGSGKFDSKDTSTPSSSQPTQKEPSKTVLT
jgi:hypothetical protein